MLERELLEELRLKTGIRSHRIQGLRTDDKALAEAALPVLVDWFDRIQDPSYRAAIVQTMNTPHAYKYFDKILEWWQHARDPEYSGFLTQLVARLLKKADAEKVWTACQRTAPDPFRIFILRRLITIPSVSAEVLDTIYRNLLSGLYDPAELEAMSAIADPRIREWFAGQLDNPDEHVSSIAMKLVNSGEGGAVQ